MLCSTCKVTPQTIYESPAFPTLEELVELKQRSFYTLLYVNAFIFIAAGGAGYFLAGRTLKPIKKMVDEQNEFIANASHEFRTPLATLQAEMEAALLEKNLSSSETRSLINSNLEELHSLQSLTNNLLRLTQTETTSNSTEPSVTSVNESVSSP
jgi:signal transduction histidine kinase